MWVCIDRVPIQETRGPKHPLTDLPFGVKDRTRAFKWRLKLWRSHIFWVSNKLCQENDATITSLHFFIPWTPTPSVNSLGPGFCSRSTRSFELDVSLALDPTTNPSYGWLSSTVKQILDSRSLYEGPTYGVTKMNDHEWTGTNFLPNLRGPHSGKKNTSPSLNDVQPPKRGFDLESKSKAIMGPFWNLEILGPGPLM